MFCRNCGAQIADDSEMCPVCGTQLKEGLNTGMQMAEYPQSTQGYQPVKEKKKVPKKGIVAGIIGVVAVCVVAGVVGLVSLLSKKSDKTDADGVSAVMSESDRADIKEMFEAYKEFYATFYDENAEKVYDYNADYSEMVWKDSWVDCAAKIIIMDDEPLLAVADYVGDRVVDGEEVYGSWTFDIYFFEYNGSEVVQKFKLKNMYSGDDGLWIYEKDGSIYVYTADEYLFLIDGDSNSEVEADAYTDSIWRSFTDSFYKEGIAPYSLIGNNVEDWLEYLSDNYTQCSNFELNRIYAQYLIDNRFTDDDLNVYFSEDGLWYRNTVVNPRSNNDEDESDTGIIEDDVSGDTKSENSGSNDLDNLEVSSDELVFCGFDEGMTDIVIPEEEEGYVVTSVDVNMGHNQSDELFLSLQEDGLTLNIQIPDSVSYINLFSDSDNVYYYRKLITIYCSENSYAKEYAEEYNIPYVIGSIDENKNDTPINPASVMDTYSMQDNNEDSAEESIAMAEWYYAYQDVVASEDASGYSLIYINAGDVPELALAVDSGNSTKIYALDESNEPVCIEYTSASYSDIGYWERKGIYYIPGLNGSEFYMRLLNYSAETQKYASKVAEINDDSVYDEFEYYLLDTQVSEEEFYDDSMIGIYNYTSLYGSKIIMYDSLEEAYQAINN